MAVATIEAAIWRALRSRVLSLPGSLPLLMPDDDGPAPEASAGQQAHIRVDHLPNRGTRLFLGSDEPELRQGILQLRLMVPVGLGWTLVQQVNQAGKIAEHFPADLPMRSDGVVVKVEKAPDVGRTLRQGPWMQTPVTVRWRIAP